VDQFQKPSNPTFDHAGLAKLTEILKIKWEAAEPLNLAPILQRNAIIFNTVPVNTEALSKIHVLATKSEPGVVTREGRGWGYEYQNSLVVPGASSKNGKLPPYA
jgi:hypothetical protein